MALGDINSAWLAVIAKHPHSKNAVEAFWPVRAGGREKSGEEGEVNAPYDLIGDALKLGGAGKSVDENRFPALSLRGSKHGLPSLLCDLSCPVGGLSGTHGKHELDVPWFLALGAEGDVAYNFAIQLGDKAD